jgi:hypothetical protein
MTARTTSLNSSTNTLLVFVDDVDSFSCPSNVVMNLKPRRRSQPGSQQIRQSRKDAGTSSYITHYWDTAPVSTGDRSLRFRIFAREGFAFFEQHFFVVGV